MELKDNTVIVVLGASGDLAKKKTVSRTTFSCPSDAINMMLTLCSTRLCSVS